MWIALKKILLINDEPDMRELIHLCLSYLGGWQVSSTHCPFEGLQWAKQEQPDAIVLALSASNMDYTTFLQRLRAQPATQTVPVIILTTSAKWFNFRSLESFHVAGVIDYLSDPIMIPRKIADLLSWNQELINQEN